MLNYHFPIRLSDSSLNLYRGCERLFQLYKLLHSGHEREDSPPTVRGRAYGAGVQEYLVSGDMDAAVYKCWLEYYPILEKDTKVCQERTINNLVCSRSKMDSLRERYEVATFKGKPAIELGYRLNINPQFYFVGFIDAVLREKATGRYGTFDVKTTGLTMEDVSPLYKYSGQLVGYSIVIDEIVGQEEEDYQVIYFACQDERSADIWVPRLHILPFNKTLLDRLNWFMSLGMDVEAITRNIELNVFPKRHNHCIHFNKVCQHFNTCHLQSFDAARAPTKEETEDEALRYDFTFELTDVIENHLQRIQRITQR